MIETEVKVVAIEPYSLKLPMIANTLHRQLNLDVVCFYTISAFRLHRYEEKDIHLLLLDDSDESLELIGTLRKALRKFPVIICVEDDTSFQRALARTMDVSAVLLYRKDNDNFLSLVRLVRDVLRHTVY